MIGLVVDVFLENCEKERFNRLVVKLFDGRKITSMCYFDEEVKHSVKVIKVYIDLTKKNNAIGKLQIVDFTDSNL